MKNCNRFAVLVSSCFVLFVSSGCASRLKVNEEALAALACVAETSQWRATGRHSDVMSFVGKLSEYSEVVRLAEMGNSAEGRSIPLIILANPPVANPADAKASGKMVVYAQGGIHSGECCGKEALLMLAREIAADPGHPLLDNLIILLAPIYNPDGNERMKKDNRPGQDGPVEGMGQRATAEGYDLNRDNTKLDSPAAQALSGLMNGWDPYLVIDTHTTNGSYHQYTLTFDGPVNPAGDRAIIDFVRDDYLPAVSRSLQQETGYLTTFYGNYNRDKTKWSTYDGRPRFGTRARGLRGIVSILTEAYKYASYKDRVLCTKSFCRHLLNYASDNRQVLDDLIADVRQRTISLGDNPSPDNKVAIRAKIARNPKDLVFHGWVEEVPVGATGRRARPQPTSVKKDYVLEHWGSYEPALEVARPLAYAFPASMTGLVGKLRQHGILFHVMPDDVGVEAEIYHVTKLNRAKRSYQGHHQVKVEVAARQERVQLKAGMIWVPCAQVLGNLVVYLLEPMAEDGLTAWNVLDDALAEKNDFPVIRVLR